MPQLINREQKELLENAVCTALGIDPAKTQRIVIDIQAHAPVEIYVQMVGTDDILAIINLPGILAQAIKEGTIK